MERLTIGLLHPGEMGAAVGGVLNGAGHRVVWVPGGRGPATLARAERFGLEPVPSLASLARRAAVILAICPPHAAEDVAASLGEFDGLYVDANATSPGTARRIAGVIEAKGGRFVDASIIGQPPVDGESPRLCLSGPSAGGIADLFASTAVHAVVVGAEHGVASAVKMAYTAWSKGTGALLLAIRAFARIEGIEDELLAAWATSPDHLALARRSLKAGEQAATRGWRWTGEMDEVAASFRDVGLPPGFHEAASEIWGGAPHDESARGDEAGLRFVLDALCLKLHPSSGPDGR